MIMHYDMGLQGNLTLEIRICKFYNKNLTENKVF